MNISTNHATYHLTNQSTRYSCAHPYARPLACQSGAVLVLALVLTALLTTLAVTLLHNNSLDVKMTNVVVEKKKSLNITIGGVDEFIQKAQTQHVDFGGINPLLINQDIDESALTGTNINASAQSINAIPTNCPHMSRSDVSDNTIRCNRYEITVKHQFGLDERSATQIVTTTATQVQVNQ